MMSIPFQGIDGNILGFGYISNPTVPMKVEELREGYRKFERFSPRAVNGMFTFGSDCVCRENFIIVQERRSLLTVGLWMFRYVLVIIDFPSAVVHSDLFDPKYFASPFGFGLASSLGNMLLTAVILCINVFILVRWYIRSFVEEDRKDLVSSTGEKIRGVAWIAIVITMLLFILRGFVALVISAVVDSALPYNNPTSIIPSIPLAAMLTTLLLAAISLVLASMIIFMYVLRLFRSVVHIRSVWIYVFVFLMLLSASLLFGKLQSAPLLGQIPRILCMMMMFGVAVVMMKNWKPRKLNVNIIIMVVSVSIVLLIPLLDNTLHDLDRDHVELLAQEIIRPEDSWLAFMMNQSLDDLSGTTARRIMESGDPDDIEKMAFTGWAKSLLSREGNNCSVTYVNRDGEIVSDFHIGISSHRTAERAVGNNPLGTAWCIVEYERKMAKP